jgi:hypothetical protein
MITNTHSWSLCTTLSKNAGSRGFPASSPEVAKGQGKRLQLRRSNHSRQFPQFTFKDKWWRAALLAGRLLLLPSRFLRFFRVFTVVRGSFPLSLALTSLPAQVVDLIIFNIGFPQTGQITSYKDCSSAPFVCSVLNSRSASFLDRQTASKNPSCPPVPPNEKIFSDDSPSLQTGFG